MCAALLSCSGGAGSAYEKYSISTDAGLDSALLSLKTNPSDYLLGDAILRYCTEKGYFDVIIDGFPSVFRHAEAEGDGRMALNCGLYLSQAYLFKDRLDSCYYYLDRVSPLVDSTGFQAAMMHNISAIYAVKAYTGYADALDHFRKAYEISQGDTLNMGVMLMNITTIYLTRRDTSGLPIVRLPRVFSVSQTAIVTASVAREMIIHNDIPRANGLIPVFLMLCTDIPQPIRKRVALMACLEHVTMPDETAAGMSSQVLASIARMKSRMNHGMEIFFPFFLKIKVVAMAIGIIQSARVSFTVVATLRASSPYAAPAPTTELVSWIAMAAQVPNCSWLIPSQCPIAGKMSSAAAFSVKTVAMESVVSSSSASMIGAIAAIALPPQIAVPEDMRYELLRESLKALPSRTPRHITPITDTIVNSMPSFPASIAECRFIPKPRPITESWSMYLEAFFVNFLNGAPKVIASSIPARSDKAVGRKNDAANSPIKRIFVILSFICPVGFMRQN